MQHELSRELAKWLLDRNFSYSAMQRGVDTGQLLIVAAVDSVHGLDNAWLEPGDDLRAFLDCPEAVYARQHGASLEDYREWLECFGMPRCAFQTRDGERCKNGVPGGLQRPLDRFIADEGGACHVHAQAASELSKMMERNSNPHPAHFATGSGTAVRGI